MSIQFGLMNRDKKYLTAEKFGNQINVTAPTMKSKQIWSFVLQNDDQIKGYLMSPQKKYLETNKNGNVICESEEKNDSFLFQVEVADNGRWAFKDIFGKYLAGNSERLYTTMSHKLNDEVLWAFHYAGHPQCNIKSVSRKRYVHLDGDELRANENIPWGKDAVLTLQFHKGLYSIRDANGNYLNGINGDLAENLDDSAMFMLFLQGNNFAFKSLSNKKFLTVYGPKGKLVASKNNVGKDEVFSIEDSKTQCVLTASNNKHLSVKQGIDVTANQFMEIEDTEIFQLDYHHGLKEKATFLCHNGKYWSAEEKSLTAHESKVSPNCVFTLEWHDHKVALKAFNGKYLASSTGGRMAPTCIDSTESSSLFTLTLVNRPLLFLRGEHGYIGEIQQTNKIQCNRGLPSTVQVLHDFDGKYRLKSSGGKFWQIDSDGFLIFEGNNGDSFYFELLGKNCLVIHTADGRLLTGDKNGSIKAVSGTVNRNNTWEY